MTTLASLFQESRGEPIEVDGKRVFAVWRQTAHAKETRIVVRRVSHSPGLVQGLSFSSEGGSFEVNGVTTKWLTLWSDNSPEEVVLIFRKKAKAACEILIWNSWKFEGRPSDWTGNSGMLVRHEANRLVLECSNGVGETNFSSFVVELTLRSTEA